ncbi:aromatic ring-hydroxylating dioxygenase subunit alpha [Chroococcidiopsis sp. FACHB-1243]|uniref:aromatic ring-hydroxylating dioxygenase subunit alpha n=1 Tax=Chroococcidiopsis sp. [FACHB-1243] TaxID=2692781 RepID=UPI00177F9BBA|nr:aromatic ring-hydroxylating dioxygenase subunit alpha [Chroococcidiopsis sp. [FACHB-1243]]MBD2307693.1 aromatic ring-hydroxylating dioxygenase subunit alpha [Chroococcidiopsis sp. [FACHB-1243]]
MQTPSLASQQRDIRQTGINPNHWYAVARSSEVTTNPIAVTLWHQAIAIYRGNDGKVYALEDRCPHRQVKLSHGRVIDNNLECAYHGWRIAENGECVDVPYLAANQKLPNCKIRHYPIREQDGFVWLFPGDLNLATQLQPLGLPEWDHLNYIATISIIECAAHYSYLIENLMDMYHGHLHQSWQAWADPVLQDIYEDKGRVDAHYQAQSYYKIDKIWSISQLFFPTLRRLRPEPLDVSYIYPNWVSTLGNDFKIYCLFSPINELKTRAYLIHFTSLNAFWRLHKLPISFRRFVKNSLFGSAQKLLDGLVLQDVQMIEEEQQAYLAHPEQKNHELNRALVSVQKLIRSQASAN